MSSVSPSPSSAGLGAKGVQDAGHDGVFLGSHPWRSHHQPLVHLGGPPRTERVPSSWCRGRHTRSQHGREDGRDLFLPVASCSSCIIYTKLHNQICCSTRVLLRQPGGALSGVDNNVNSTTDWRCCTCVLLELPVRVPLMLRLDRIWSLTSSHSSWDYWTKPSLQVCLLKSNGYKWICVSHRTEAWRLLVSCFLPFTTDRRWNMMLVKTFNCDVLV